MKKRKLLIFLACCLALFLLTTVVFAEGEDAAEAVEVAEAVEEAAEEEASSGFFAGTFWALVPPILAIALALITKEVYSSLFFGILLGGLFVGGFSPLKSISAITNDGLISAVSGNAGIFVFLVILGVFVSLINKTGAAAAFGKWAQKHIKTRVGAALATFVLGVLIFIDDYFNCLTVGSVMLPVTDSHRISRAKLAYLIDATAAPVCMIAPISSWAAAVASYADGTQYSGIEMFVRAIPYNFYSLLTIVFILTITITKFDYGPMALHEKNAIEKGDLFTVGGEKDNGIRANENAKGKVIDIVIPVIILIVVCVISLIYVGVVDVVTDWEFVNMGESEFFSSYAEIGFIKAFSETDSTIGLPWGALIALIITIIYLICRRVITFKDAMESLPEGFKAMVPAITILTLATALKNMTSALEAREFIAGIMEGAAEGLNMFLPAIIFLVACLLAFATGTSWGTFGVLIPIVTAIFDPTSPLLFIGMSACLAGAVCGDHCSPISDTTIMSSAGARCEHLNHVSTQIPYALTVAGISFVAFILAGLIQNWFIVFPISVVLTVGTLFVIQKVAKKN